jgi:hypothetical protein
MRRCGGPFTTTSARFCVDVANSLSQVVNAPLAESFLREVTAQPQIQRVLERCTSRRLTRGASCRPRSTGSLSASGVEFSFASAFVAIGGNVSARRVGPYAGVSRCIGRPPPRAGRQGARRRWAGDRSGDCTARGQRVSRPGHAAYGPPDHGLGPQVEPTWSMFQQRCTLRNSPSTPTTGRLMKGWLTITSPKASWVELTKEAHEFVQG